jgi:hypothetical protein
LQKPFIGPYAGHVIIVYINTVDFVTSILILSSHFCTYIHGAETPTIQIKEELGLA